MIVQISISKEAEELRNARYASAFTVGGHVLLWGRIQSREYMKRIGENQSERRTAYEVSVSKLEYID